METQNKKETEYFSTVKAGRHLTSEEIKEINLHRQRVFGNDDPIAPSAQNKDWTNLFFLIKDSQGKLLSFGRLHPIKLTTAQGEKQAECFSMVVSAKEGKGYGRQVMDALKKHSQETGTTIIGFCETDLIPFYRKCGWGILTPKENQFVYADENGETLPGIVPGEVIYYQGSDRLIDSILKSEDKTVRVPLKHHE